MASAIRCSSVASWSGTSSCALRSHNKVDVTVKNLQQRHELVDGLTVVRLIHEPIELGRGSPESAAALTLRSRARRDSLLSPQRQSAPATVPQAIATLRAPKDLIDMDPALPTPFEPPPEGV